MDSVDSLKELAEDPTILARVPVVIAGLKLARTLLQARAWLYEVNDFADPTPLVEARAWAIEVDQQVRRLKLSRSIELDAAEILRRCERGLGLAIRNGQANGSIGSRENPGNRPRRDYVRNGKLVQVGQTPGKASMSPRDFLPGKQHAFEIYILTDGVSDEDFEKAIAAARAEDNLSRANLIRKVTGAAEVPREDLSRAPRRRKAERIAALAEDGLSSRQIGEVLGIADDTIRSIAREFKVDIAADKIMSRTRRHDSNRIVAQTVDTLSSLIPGLDLIDYDDLDPAEVGQWVTSMDESFRALNRFRTQLKKVTHQ